MEHRFVVEGMTCDHCVRAVSTAVRRVDPAAAVDVDLAAGTVVVDSQAASGPFVDAIREEGYSVVAPS